MELSESLVVKKCLQDMLDVLRCDKCNKLLNEPRSLGGCSHIFCKACTLHNRDYVCPVCEIPYELKACRPDHVLTDVLANFQALSRTMNFKPNKDTESKLIEDIPANEPTPEPMENTSAASIAPLDTTSSDSSAATPRRKSVGKRDLLQTSLRSSTPVSHTKRNVKGETPLQRAVIKGNVALVKELLADGATPNTKDFAGWTPLHEACQRDFIEIIQLLLEHGANVNTPGLGNTTPLHDAVQAYKLEAVRLLVSHGANIHALDDTGKSPMDYSGNEIMKAALNTLPMVKLSTAHQVDEYCPPEKPCLFSVGQNREEAALLADLARLVKGRTLSNYTSRVDFAVVMTGQGVANNVALYSAMLEGKWVVRADWVNLCVSEGRLVDPRPFELEGTEDYPESHAFRKARRNAEQQLPKLFNNCWFYLNGTFKNPSKQDVIKLIKEGGGLILSRSPNPEAIPVEERKRPYHAAVNSDLAECSHYIIYQPGGRNEPPIKYNMKHVKALPSQWLLDCLGNFSLINPATFI